MSPSLMWRNWKVAISVWEAGQSACCNMTSHEAMVILRGWQHRDRNRHEHRCSHLLTGRKKATCLLGCDSLTGFLWFLCQDKRIRQFLDINIVNFSQRLLIFVCDASWLSSWFSLRDHQLTASFLRQVKRFSGKKNKKEKTQSII